MNIYFAFLLFDVLHLLSGTRYSNLKSPLKKTQSYLTEFSPPAGNKSFDINDNVIPSLSPTPKLFSKKLNLQTRSQITYKRRIKHVALVCYSFQYN